MANCDHTLRQVRLWKILRLTAAVRNAPTSNENCRNVKNNKAGKLLFVLSIVSLMSFCVYFGMMSSFLLVELFPAGLLTAASIPVFTSLQHTTCFLPAFPPPLSPLSPATFRLLNTQNGVVLRAGHNQIITVA